MREKNLRVAELNWLASDLPHRFNQGIRFLIVVIYKYRNLRPPYQAAQGSATALPAIPG
jgi:hypothetical protein